MTAAEKLRMEIAQEAPFSKDEFISKISRLIKAYGYASFICDKHIRETNISSNGNTLALQFGNALPKYITGCKSITVVNCAARWAHPRAVA